MKWPALLLALGRKEQVNLVAGLSDSRRGALLRHEPCRVGGCPLSNMARGQGRIEEAAIVLGQSIALHHDVRNMFGMAICPERLGGVTLDRQQPERALRLLAAVEALYEAIGAPLMPAERAQYERDRIAARAMVGETAYEAAWTQGRAISSDRAVAYALESLGTP